MVNMSEGSFSSWNPGVYSHIAFKLDQPQEEHHPKIESGDFLSTV